ncbi:helix-turn-helix transcriptional regulator [Phenylobacterium koreense]
MVTDPRYLDFGEAMALRRDQLKMTQAQLASRVGMSRASIANIERGRQNVLLHHACDIATALGLSQVGDLLPLDGRSSLEDQSLVLSDTLSPKAKAQISDLIANAVAQGRS